MSIDHKYPYNHSCTNYYRPSGETNILVDCHWVPLAQGRGYPWAKNGFKLAEKSQIVVELVWVTVSAFLDIDICRKHRADPDFPDRFLDLESCPSRSINVSWIVVEFIIDNHGLRRAVSAFEALIANACTVFNAGSIVWAQVHKSATRFHHWAACICSFVALQSLVVHIVEYELVSRLVIVSLNKVARLWNSEIRKVFGLTPVSADNKIRVVWLRHVVNLTWLSPEVFAAFKLKLTQPKLLGLRAVLGIKFSCVEK